MRGIVRRGGLVSAASCALLLTIGGAAGATTVPEDTKGGTAADPVLTDAMDAFEARMTAAGYVDQGEPDVVEESEPIDPALLTDCDPKVADLVTSMSSLDEAFGHGAPLARSNTFGPPADPATSTATTEGELFSLDGTEEVSATAYRLSEDQIAMADEMIALFGSPEFGPCLQSMITQQMMMDTGMDTTDMTIPDFTMPDFTMPDISMPDMADLSIPEMPDFTMPDFTIPEMSMPDVSMPDFSSIPGMTPTIEITEQDAPELGDVSGSFVLNISMMLFVPLEIRSEALFVRQGDVFVTVTHDVTNLPTPTMDVDLAAEAEAILATL